jgi:hypothetical protein
MNNGLYSNRPGRLFVSPLFSVVAGQIADIPHGLAGKPQFVNWVLECQSPDVGFIIGDEINAITPFDNATGTWRFTSGASASHVFLILYNGVGTLAVFAKTDGAIVNLTLSRWRAKCYARYFGP